ncbi:MAG: TIGR03435 family protein [Terracidiphilus sp.]|jgi:uncharacterized protein (TIGR03435 family)
MRRLIRSHIVSPGPVGWAAIAITAALCVLHATQICAQPHSEETARFPAFEIAAIRPNSPADLRIGFWFTPDGISVTGAPLQMILGEAFHSGDDHIFGVPGWARSARYDIQAKVSEADVPKWRKLSMDQQTPALRSLLVDRFSLRFHHETRELPVYTLAIAKGGPKLNASVSARSSAPAEPPKEFLMWTSPDHLEARHVSMEDLIRELGWMVGNRTILDKTGLSGSYDFQLHLNRDQAAQPSTRPESGLPGSGSSPDPDAGDTALFTALREQLGLNLELRNLPSDVIVIDHIDKPTAN